VSSQIKERDVQGMGKIRFKHTANYCQEREVSKHHTFGFIFTKVGVPILCKIGCSSAVKKSKYHGEPGQIKTENSFPQKRHLPF